jgi:hypothetical protein
VEGKIVRVRERRREEERGGERRREEEKRGGCGIGSSVRVCFGQDCDIKVIFYVLWYFVDDCCLRGDSISIQIQIIY